jgi:hypothetical protein
MKTKRMTVRLGDLIAALYDEAQMESKQEKVRSAIVGLALNDLLHQTRKSKDAFAKKHKKIA